MKLVDKYTLCNLTRLLKDTLPLNNLKHRHDDGVASVQQALTLRDPILVIAFYLYSWSPNCCIFLQQSS